MTVGDHGLFLSMAYPRPVLAVNGTRDPIFPISGARLAVEQAKRLYAAGGHADGVEFAEFDVPHDWTDAMIDRQIGWFRRRFDLPELAILPAVTVPMTRIGSGATPTVTCRRAR